jgi:hypothetical protein
VKRIPSIILFIFESFVGAVVQNEKILLIKYILKVTVTDYLLQHLQKLFELFLQIFEGQLSTACKLTKFGCGAPLPFTSLLKGLRQLVVLLQKVISYPLEPFACGIRELHATTAGRTSFLINKKTGRLKNP